MDTGNPAGKGRWAGRRRSMRAAAMLLVLGGLAVFVAAAADLPAGVPCGAQGAGPSERSRGTGTSAVERPPVRVKRFLAEVYGRREDETLRADVWVPESTGPVPAVLLIHGGAWTVGTRWQMLFHAQRLVEAGFATVSIDYRLAPRWKYPAQIEDCREAWRWMCREADRFGWDKNQMAVYGYSAGAHLALLLALDNTAADLLLPRPKAVVAGGAPCSLDWLPPDSQILAHFLGGTRREIPEVYRQASPVTHVSADDPPVLLFHGANDLLVPLANPRRLESRLQQLGVPCELVVYQGLGHVATFLAKEPPVRAAAFLAKHLPTCRPDEAGR